MRKNIVKAGVIIALASAVGMSSCIGNFALTNRLLSWNKTIGNKFVNELVFFAFWVLPVYEISAAIDAVVINSIEFWSGTNPMACGTKRIQGADGRNFLVKCDGKGYDVVCEDDGTSVRLDFNADEQTWSLLTAEGEAYPLIAFGESGTATLPLADGQQITVDLNASGVMAYRAAARTLPYASR